MLIVELVAQILGLRRPMAAEHIFDAATASPTPIKFRLASIDQLISTWSNVAIVDHSGLVIHTDAAASCVKQPVAEGEAKAAADGRVKVTIRFAMGIRGKEDTVDSRSTVPIQVHVAAVGLHAEDEPVPLKVVTNLAAANYSGFVIAP